MGLAEDKPTVYDGPDTRQHEEEGPVGMGADRCTFHVEKEIEGTRPCLHAECKTRKHA